jgi:hypothetical protein
MFRLTLMSRRPCRIDWGTEQFEREQRARQYQQMEQDLCKCRTLLFRLSRGTLRSHDPQEIRRQLDLHRHHRREDIQAEIRERQFELRSIDNLQHQLREPKKLLERRPALVDELIRLQSLNLNSDDILDRDI